MLSAGMLKTAAFCVLTIAGLPGVVEGQRKNPRVAVSPAPASGAERALYRLEGSSAFEFALEITGGMPVATIAASADSGSFKLAAGVALDTLWLTVFPISVGGSALGGSGTPWDVVAEQFFLRETRAHLFAGTGRRGNGDPGALLDRVTFVQLMDVDGFAREIVLPRLDHSSTDNCSIRIAIVPVKVIANWNPKVVEANHIDLSNKPACLVKNFTMAVGTLPTTSAVVEPVSMRRVTQTSGTGRDRTITSAVQMSPIHLRIAESEATPWYAWYDSFVIGGRNAPTDERPLRLTFPGGAVRLEANVGIVSFRPVSENGAGFVDIELYANLTKLQREAVGAAGAGVSPPPADAGNNAVSVVSDPPEAAGSFRVQLPSAAFSGTGSACAEANETSTLLITLSGANGSGLIAGRGPRLRVGSFDVALEGDNTVQMTISRVGGTSYAAKRGFLTVTKAGAQTSGTFRVLADVFEATGEVKEISISGSFTDLPKKC